MFQSKRLISGRFADEKTKLERLYWKIYYKVEYTWPVMKWRAVKHWFRCLKRWISWRKVVWENYDCESHYIFHLLAEKLARMEVSLKNGCAYQEPRDMKALVLAVKLAKRVRDCDYGERAYNRHDKKWGKLQTWFETTEDGKRSYYRSSRPKADTPEKQEQERAEFLAGVLLGDKTEARDVRNLFEIIAKYYKVWWD